MVDLFYSYSHKDERHREKLETHLASLKRQGVVAGWHDREISAGEKWAKVIDEHLKSANVILLLVSPDFLSSDYCYGEEVRIAMHRHHAGEAVVIPVILRPCDWKHTLFAELQALPRDARAITTWSNRDEAFTDVAQGIRSFINKRAESTVGPKLVVPLQAERGEETAIPPSNRFLNRYAAKLMQWKGLGPRWDKNFVLKKNIAEFFMDLYLPIMLQGGVRKLYFESGTSIAYLAEVYSEQLGHPWLRGATSMEVETNNIFCYLEFIFAHVHASMYPVGAPEDRYGATLGELSHLPPLPPGVINGDVAAKVGTIIKHFDENYATAGIVFGSTSGIDLDHGSSQPGPHVGSYHHMLIKRAILASAAPVVLFTDEQKLPCPAVTGKCFSVCDEELSWSYVCQSKPLALACAFTNEERAMSILPTVESWGFTHVQRSRSNAAPWSMIAANEHFHCLTHSWRPKQ